MIDTLGVGVSNYYKHCHMGKTKLLRQCILPRSLKASRELIAAGREPMDRPWLAVPTMQSDDDTNESNALSDYDDGALDADENFEVVDIWVLQV